MKEILFYREGKADYPSFFSDKLICKWIEVIAGHYNKSVGAINFIFCDDDYILVVNRQYLKHDYYTDVITFEFCRVICHSVLHLIGFKDKTDVDSKEMRKNENICLDLLKTL